MPPPRKFDDNDKWSIAHRPFVEMQKICRSGEGSPHVEKHRRRSRPYGATGYDQSCREVKPTRGFQSHSPFLAPTLVYPDGSQALIQAYGIGKKNGKHLRRRFRPLIRLAQKVNIQICISTLRRGDENPTSLFAFRCLSEGIRAEIYRGRRKRVTNAGVGSAGEHDNVPHDTYIDAHAARPRGLFLSSPTCTLGERAMCWR